MGEAMSSLALLVENPAAPRRADAELAVAGRLPDAPLAMPTQVLEQPSRVGHYLRGILQRWPGRVET